MCGRHPSRGASDVAHERRHIVRALRSSPCNPWHLCVVAFRHIPLQFGRSVLTHCVDLAAKNADAVLEMGGRAVYSSSQRSSCRPKLGQMHHLVGVTSFAFNHKLKSWPPQAR